MEYALLQAVFLPLLLSPLAYYIGRVKGPTYATWFTFGILLYCTILVINASLGGTYEEHYPWTDLFGEFGFLLDGLASPFAIMIYVLCTILALYSKPYMVHKFEEVYKQIHNIKEDESDGQSTALLESSGLKTYVNNQSGLYFAMFLVFSMGMLGTVLSTNLIEFYIFFEVMLIPSFFLIASPFPSEASINSLASFKVMVFSDLDLALLTSQRMANAWRLEDLTSRGI